jgi:hypothetical protein
VIRFHDDQDRQLFLMEVGKSSQSGDTADDHGQFIKSRAFVVPMLKNFRRRHQSHLNWTRHRQNILMPLRRFHHSPEGRRMHRQLGRFLATRILPDKMLTGNSLSFTKHEALDLRQFLLDECQYYHGLIVQAELELVIEDLTDYVGKFLTA